MDEDMGYEERLRHLLLMNVTWTSLPRSAADAQWKHPRSCVLGDSGCAKCGYYVIPLLKVPKCLVISDFGPCMPEPNKAGLDITEFR